MGITVGRTSFGRDPENSSYHRIALDWTSNANGVASDTITLAGRLVQVVSVPTSGSEPTEPWSFRLRDPENSDLDWLNSKYVQNLTSDSSQFFLLSDGQQPVLLGDVQAHVSDAGGSKSGTLYVFLKS